MDVTADESIAAVVVCWQDRDVGISLREEGGGNLWCSSPDIIYSKPTYATFCEWRLACVSIKRVHKTKKKKKKKKKARHPLIGHVL